MKKLFIFSVLASLAFMANGEDKVSFTRHAYDEGGYLYKTYATSSETPYATVTRQYQPGKERERDFTILSIDLKPVHSFSITAPNGYDYIEKLNQVGEAEDAIQEILVTQHLFNNDDLYEVILGGDGMGYVIYNEKGKFLGECPSLKLYYAQDRNWYLYCEDDTEGANGQNISALYSINKGGSSAVQMKRENSRMRILPNPVTEDETVRLILPDEIESDASIRIFGINGTLLTKKDCKKGEKEISVPSSMLTKGVNPVIAVDPEGNIICSGKIVKE